MCENLVCNNFQQICCFITILKCSFKTEIQIKEIGEAWSRFLNLGPIAALGWISLCCWGWGRGRCSVPCKMTVSLPTLCPRGSDGKQSVYNAGDPGSVPG